MRVVVNFSIFLLSIFLWVSCNVREEGEISPVMLSKTIVPKVKESSQSAESETAQSYEEEDSAPKVSIKKNEILLHLLSVNLDLDKTDEQILILKHRSDEKSPLRVAIVDFDEIRDTHARTWEHELQATNPRALRIETEDIVGDYNIEIICRGLDSKEELTLDVFRKTTSPTGLGLYYSPICQLFSDRRIKILREKRSQAYELGQKYGQSFPIVVERGDSDSENHLDIIRETYHWSYQDKRYVMTTVEEIPGDELQQKQLLSLFSGKSTKPDFEEFLKGPWFKQNEIENIIFFNPEYQTVNFYDGNVLEIYLIEDFIRHGYRLSMITSNNTISSIKKWINVDIQSTNAVEISTSSTQHKYALENEQWEGRYNRLTSDQMESFIQTERAQVKVSHIDISGIFRNNQGLEIAFEPPYFTWIDEVEGGASGGFSILFDIPLLNGFYLERDIPDRVSIITFRFLNESGIPEEDKVFVLEHQINEDNNTVVKTIHLTSANLIVNGAVLTTKESLTLEQIEIVQ